jgi:hypothetical protein
LIFTKQFTKSLKQFAEKIDCTSPSAKASDRKEFMDNVKSFLDRFQLAFNTVNKNWMKEFPKIETEYAVAKENWRMLQEHFEYCLVSVV